MANSHSDAIHDSVRVVIAFGSNITDRLMWLRCGLNSFRLMKEIDVIAVSSIYESAPVGENLYGDFLNAIIVIDTTLPPDALLAACRKVESECGRDRNYENKSSNRNRTLDCDIIFYGDEKIETENLIIPHQSWQDRCFVIMPLLDVAEHLTPNQRHAVESVKFDRNYEVASCRRVTDVLD